MIKLIDGQTDTDLGEITEDQLQFLIDNLVEEFLEDQDYAITPLTMAYFEGKNADPRLLSLLRRALGDHDEVIIHWVRE